MIATVVTFLQVNSKKFLLFKFRSSGKVLISSSATAQELLCLDYEDVMYKQLNRGHYTYEPLKHAELFDEHQAMVS